MLPSVYFNKETTFYSFTLLKSTGRTMASPRCRHFRSHRRIQGCLVLIQLGKFFNRDVQMAIARRGLFDRLSTNELTETRRRRF